jgi:hypothetical protein
VIAETRTSVRTHSVAGVDPRSGLRLIEHSMVTDEARPLKSDCIPDAQTTPSHQERERPKASAVCGPGLPAIFPIQIRGVDDRADFFTREASRSASDLQ